MGVTIKVSGLDRLGSRLIQAAVRQRVIEAGVKVYNDPGGDDIVAYALVWEWGSSRIKQPGPRTVLSTNPAGDVAILSSQAPHGYIRIHEPEYMQILKEEWEKISWSTIELDDWPETVTEVLIIASDRCAKIISEAAPKDTYALSEHIVAVHPGDSVLHEADAALILGSW